MIFPAIIFSGCIENEPWPVYTADVILTGSNVWLGGSASYCEFKSQRIVIDTVEHSEYYYYAHSYPATKLGRAFWAIIDLNDFEPNVTYHYRAVAYCYNFTRPNPLYPEFQTDFYAGDDKTFSLENLSKLTFDISDIKSLLPYLN